MALVNTDDSLLTQGFFKTKFWGKLLGMLSKKQNDLGINASSGSSTKFLNEQGNFVTLSGAYPDMTAGGQYVPRSNGDLNTQHSKNTFNVVEYQNTASHRPTPNGWYYSLAMCGGDSGFGAQIAPGMTIDRIFWRNKKDGTSGNWREIPSFPGITGVGSASQPVYVDSEGTVKECSDIAPEFWITNTTTSVKYATLAKTGLTTDGLSRVTLEIGPIVPYGSSSTNNGKIIVTLQSFRGGNDKASVLYINLVGLVTEDKFRFYTYKDSNYIYLVMKRATYMSGAYAKVTSHGNEDWAVNLGDSTTAPSGITDANVTYVNMDPAT